MAILREHIAARDKRLAELVAKQDHGGAFYLEGTALIWDITYPIKDKLLVVPYLPIYNGIIIKRSKLNDHRWQEIGQDAGLPLLTWAQTCPILAEVVRFLPEDEKKLALSVRHLQISMLNRCLQSDAFKQLCESDFNLAWLFLGYAQQAQLSNEDMEQWLTRSRLDLLELIAGHRQKWMLKWLRKVTAGVGDVHEWKRLNRWLRDPQHLAYLKGFGKASVSFLQLITRLDVLVDIRQWHEDLEHCKSQSGDEVRRWLWTVKETAEDVQRLGKALGIPSYSHFDHINSFKGLQRRHDKWLKRINRQLPDEDGELGVFPKPPLAGTECIRPVQTFMQLYDEGRRMNHCVQAYRDDIDRGERYIYRYHGEQRATIELVCLNGIWSLGQIKGKANSDPTPETLSAVQAWFDEYEYSEAAYIKRRWENMARPNDVFFPAPPYVTCPPMTALETEKMYRIEQNYMNGHIQSTLEQIHQGKRYVYRVDDPDAERVIEFEKMANGNWEVMNAVRRDGTRRQNDTELLEWWLGISDPAFGWPVLE